MLVQSTTELGIIGTCSDCGRSVQQRKECVDGMTHSTVELCETCWNAYLQRQVFADGCCG
jgi:hypothetical protein